jgi:hypothetical protein
VLAVILLAALFLVAVYYVVRSAVFHALLDADEVREDQRREQARRDALRTGQPYPGGDLTARRSVSAGSGKRPPSNFGGCPPLPGG